MKPDGRVHTVITDRLGGVSAAPYDSRNLGGAVGDEPDAVRRNRERTAEEFGADPARVVYLRQVHGADVAYATAPFGDEPPALDAVFTDVPGLALCVLVADCAPVLVADAEAGLVGAASGPLVPDQKRDRFLAACGLSSFCRSLGCWRRHTGCHHRPHGG